MDRHLKERSQEFLAGIERDILKKNNLKTSISRNHGQYVIVCHKQKKGDGYIGHLYILDDPTVFTNQEPATLVELDVMLDEFVRAREGKPAREVIEFKPAKNTEIY
jgi:hypothetical protein